MNNFKDLIVLGLVGASVIGAFFYLDVENSLLGKTFEHFTDVNFNEVIPRNIVKNSIPIILLEEDNGSCKVYGEKFSQITDHNYFVRSQELSDQLQYDPQEHTLIFPCEQIPDEKSRLDIWYVTSESEKHPTKFDYWITPWSDTVVPGT